jgi:tRNA pseudouridine55 synthase
MLTDETKTYEAVLQLGVVTDTQDLSGEVLSRHPVNCTKEDVISCIESFCGDQLQIPPMYSALKVNGKKLYELAREGKTVERKPRPVTFYEIRILTCNLPRVTFEVTCSKGTYIRTLCHDIGEKLACGGAMEHLIRRRVGRFTDRDALTLTQVETLRDENRIHECLIPVDAMFDQLEKAYVKPEFDILVHNGNALYPDRILSEGAFLSGPNENLSKRNSVKRIRLYDSTGRFMGIYKYEADRGIYKPEKMFIS